MISAESPCGGRSGAISILPQCSEPGPGHRDRGIYAKAPISRQNFSASESRTRPTPRTSNRPTRSAAVGGPVQVMPLQGILGWQSPWRGGDSGIKPRGLGRFSRPMGPAEGRRPRRRTDQFPVNSPPGPSQESGPSASSCNVKRSGWLARPGRRRFPRSHDGATSPRRRARPGSSARPSTGGVGRSVGVMSISEVGASGRCRLHAYCFKAGSPRWVRGFPPTASANSVDQPKSPRRRDVRSTGALGGGRRARSAQTRGDIGASTDPLQHQSCRFADLGLGAAQRQPRRCARLNRGRLRRDLRKPATSTGAAGPLGADQVPSGV